MNFPTKHAYHDPEGPCPYHTNAKVKHKWKECPKYSRESDDDENERLKQKEFMDKMNMLNQTEKQMLVSIASSFIHSQGEDFASSSEAAVGGKTAAMDEDEDSREFSDEDIDYATVPMPVFKTEEESKPLHEENIDTSFIIYIIFPDGDIRQVNLPNYGAQTTIQAFKKMVEQSFGRNKVTNKLICDGETLDDDKKSFGDYNIQSGSYVVAQMQVYVYLPPQKGFLLDVSISLILLFLHAFDFDLDID